MRILQSLLWTVNRIFIFFYLGASILGSSSRYVTSVTPFCYQEVSVIELVYLKLFFILNLCDSSVQWQFA